MLGAALLVSLVASIVWALAAVSAILAGGVAGAAVIDKAQWSALRE